MILITASILIVAWGALAFGAVYPWAYAPLLVASAAAGAVGLFELAQTDGIMPIVRRTARFNRHRDLILSLFKHPPARRLFFRRMTGRSVAAL